MSQRSRASPRRSSRSTPALPNFRLQCRVKIDFRRMELQLEQLQNTSRPAITSATSRNPAGPRLLARPRAGSEQLPDQGGGAWSPAHSERSGFHHHVQELGARIKALQKSKPVPVEADGSPSAGSFASATSAAPKETIPAAATQRTRRRHAAEDAVVTPPGLPAPPQDYDDESNLIFENTNFIPTTTAVRDTKPREFEDPQEIRHLRAVQIHRLLHHGAVKRKVKKRKKKKKVARSRERTPTPYRVKSTELKLASWPTAVGSPAWRRALRIAVAGASDRPEKAKPWVFEVEVWFCTYA